MSALQRIQEGSIYTHQVRHWSWDARHGRKEAARLLRRERRVEQRVKMVDGLLIFCGLTQTVPDKADMKEVLSTSVIAPQSRGSTSVTCKGARIRQSELDSLL